MFYFKEKHFNIKINVLIGKITAFSHMILLVFVFFVFNIDFVSLILERVFLFSV